jgi:hypothetical protein
MTSTGVPDDAYTLAWYCVQLLVDTIRDLSPLSYYSQNPEGQGTARKKVDEEDNIDIMKADDDRTHRLSLMLISTISSLPVTIMLRALDEIYIIINAIDDGNKDDEEEEEEGSQSERNGRGKKELLEALFSEILEKIGDGEKEAAMKWWYTYCRVLISESGGYVEGQGPLGASSKKKKGVEKVEKKDVDDVAAGEKKPTSSNSSILSRL